MVCRAKTGFCCHERTFHLFWLSMIIWSVCWNTRSVPVYILPQRMIMWHNRATDRVRCHDDLMTRARFKYQRNRMSKWWSEYGWASGWSILRSYNFYFSFHKMKEFQWPHLTLRRNIFFGETEKSQKSADGWLFTIKSAVANQECLTMEKIGYY